MNTFILLDEQKHTFYYLQLHLDLPNDLKDHYTIFFSVDV